MAALSSASVVLKPHKYPGGHATQVSCPTSTVPGRQASTEYDATSGELSICTPRKVEAAAAEERRALSAVSIAADCPALSAATATVRSTEPAETVTLTRSVLTFASEANAAAMPSVTVEL